MRGGEFRAPHFQAPHFHAPSHKPLHYNAPHLGGYNNYNNNNIHFNGAGFKNAGCKCSPLGWFSFVTVISMLLQLASVIISSIHLTSVNLLIAVIFGSVNFILALAYIIVICKKYSKDLWERKKPLLISIIYYMLGFLFGAMVLIMQIIREKSEKASKGREAVLILQGFFIGFYGIMFYIVLIRFTCCKCFLCNNDSDVEPLVETKETEPKDKDEGTPETPNTPYTTDTPETPDLNVDAITLVPQDKPAEETADGINENIEMTLQKNDSDTPVVENIEKPQ